MGSKGTSQYQTTTGPPAWLASAYQSMAPQIAAAANTPFQPYTGELVAPVNPEEYGGISQINQFSIAAQPYLTAAGDLAASAATVTPNDIAAYYNPYVSTVGGATLNEMERLNAAQNENVVGNAISQGAWGGDRAPVAQAEVAGAQAAAEAPTLAGINQSAYQQALQMGLSEQQARLAAAYGLGNIGQGIQTAGLSGAGAEIQGGQLQQGTQQALDTAQLQQYYTALGYPFQSLGWEASVLGSLGSTAGGTSQTTAPAPNPLTQILGLAAAGTGAYLGAGHERGGAIRTPRGYQEGGAPMMPYSGGYSFIPTYAPHGGTGPPRPPIDPSYMMMREAMGGGGGGSNLSNLGGEIGKYFGRKGTGIDTSGAGAGFPREGSADADYVTMMDPELGASTGGAVWPEHAGLGFAGLRGYQDGGDPPAAGLTWPVLSQDDKDQFADETMRAMNASAESGQPLPARYVAASRDPSYIYTPNAGPVRDDPNQRYQGSWEGPGTPLTHAVVQANMDRANASGRGQYAPPPPSPYAPTGLNPAGGVGSSRYLPEDYGGLAQRPEDTRSFGEKISLPLMQAGFAMMASRSPFLGVGIGEGGLAGIGGYLAQEREKRAAEEKQEDIGLRAKQLSELAKQHQDMLAQAQQRTGYEMLPNGTMRAIPGGPADPDVMRRAAEAKGEDWVPYTDINTGEQGLINKRTGEYKRPGGAPGPLGTPGAGGQQSGSQIADAQGFVPKVSQFIDSGENYNYGRGAPPHIEKGMQVPDPSPIAGRSSDAIKVAAQSYLQTGKLGPGFTVSHGNTPLAIQQNLASSAVINYANALAASRGLTPQQIADTWQTSNSVGRFIMGPSGQQTVSLGTAMRHLDTMRQLADEWNKAAVSNDWRTVRALQASLSREFGGEAVTNLDTAAHIVGPEIIKAIGVAGGGSAEERANAASQFTAAAGHDQIIGAVNTAQHLMLGQLEGKENQAKAVGLSQERFRALVGEKEYDRLRQIEGGGGAPAPAATAPAAPAAAPVIPARPSGVPAGSQYSPARKQWRTPDGKILDATGAAVGAP